MNRFLWVVACGLVRAGLTTAIFVGVSHAYGVHVVSYPWLALAFVSAFVLQSFWMGVEKGLDDVELRGTVEIKTLGEDD